MCCKGAKNILIDKIDNIYNEIVMAYNATVINH